MTLKGSFLKDLEKFFEGGIYGDFFNLDHRTEQLDILITGIDEATGGLVNLGKLLQSRSILDIGMGKGALGNLLHTKGYRGRIVGVDPHEYKENAYAYYSRKIFLPIQEADQELKGESFDCIVCFTPAKEVLEWLLINNFDLLPLDRDGIIIIATEMDIDHQGDFQLFHGSSHAISCIRNILIYQKPE